VCDLAFKGFVAWNGKVFRAKHVHRNPSLPLPLSVCLRFRTPNTQHPTHVAILASIKSLRGHLAALFSSRRHTDLSHTPATSSTHLPSPQSCRPLRKIPPALSRYLESCCTRSSTIFQPRFMLSIDGQMLWTYMISVLELSNTSKRISCHLISRRSYKSQTD